jgi:DNA-binding transcriptional MerR regulator
MTMTWKSRLTDKPYFRIEEVSDITRLPISMLTDWEDEFTGTQPVITPSARKLYAKENVELFLKIKHLLLVEKLSTEQAKSLLNHRPSAITLEDIRRELRIIRDILS